MASKLLIDEYIAMGGNEDVSALSDDEVRIKINQMLGINPMVTQAAVELPEMQIPKPQPKTAQEMSDEELLQLLSNPPPHEEAYTEPVAVQEALNEQSMREKTDARNFIENVSDPETAAWVLGRMGAQAGGSALNMMDLPAQAAGLYGLASLGTEELANLINGDAEKPNLGSAAALDYANDRYIEALNTFNVGEPRNVEESLAGITGMMLPIPGGGKLTGAQNMLEVVTPFVVGGNKAPRIAVNFATAAAMDQGVRELTDQADANYETVFDRMGTGDVEDLWGLEMGTVAAAATIPLFGPAAARAWAGNYQPPPTIRALNELDRLGPENLYSITKTSDVLSGYIFSDVDAINAIARRAGVPDPDMLQRQFDTTTQSGANSRVSEALNTGQLPTVNGTFTAPVAPRQIVEVFDLMTPQQQIDINNYLLMGNYSDIIKRRMSMDQDAMAEWLKANPPGTETVAEKPVPLSKPSDAEELLNISQQREAMRQNIPMLNEFSKGIQQLTEAARSFIATGPYGLISAKTKGVFDKTQPHYIPIKQTGIDPNAGLLERMVQASKETAYQPTDTISWLENRDIGNITLNTLGTQEGAIPSVIDYVSSVLHNQMKNNARGAYIDQMLQSDFNEAGKPLIRLAKKDEMKDPKNSNRIVHLVRNGKDEYYITESYIARTLQLDPYVLTNPIAMGLFSTRRAFEHGTTGALSVTFPFTSLIRDTISGWANTSKGSKAPGFGVITAPFEILGAKAMRAFYQSVDDRIAAGKPFLIPGLDEASQKQLSARIAATYQNTFYHLAQQHGGYDASIMRDRIQLAKGPIAEAIKAIPKPVSSVYNASLGRVFAGIGAILDATLEAPRYNVAKRNTKAGKTVEDALMDARNMTGDTAKSGRVYDDKGLITGDVVDPKKSVANPVIGGVVESLRVAAPYFNPTIKGLQRVAQAAAADPVRFAMRNWLAVGLPSVAGYAWNSMLSAEGEHDYLDYQFNRRSTDEQVMEMYFGVPGLPPERGVSIPIAHESTPFMAPFLTYLYHMGSSGEEMQRAMTESGLSVAGNMLQVGLPPAVSGFLSFNGVSGIDTMIGGGNQPYNTREDNVGVLPQNIENTLRNMFGTISQTGLEAISAFADDKEIADGVNEFANSLMKKLPIVKGIGGWRTNGAYFTPLSSQQSRKLDAYYAFDEAWSTHFDREGLAVSPSSPPGEVFPDVDNPDGNMLTVPFASLGPQPTMRPVNPLYELFGQQIHDTLAKKDPYGFPDTMAQMRALTTQVRLLKGFNAGRADDFQELQRRLEEAPQSIEAATEAVAEAQAAYDALPSGTKTTTPEGRQLKAELDAAKNERFTVQSFADTAKFLEEQKIDLSNRFDVIRLTNLMEQRRVDLMKYQLNIIEQVENDLTLQLQAQGLLPPGEHFRFEKHLDPKANPGLEAVREPPPTPSAIGQVAAE